MQAIEEKFQAVTRGPNRIIPGVVLATANQDATWAKSFGTVSSAEGAADMKDDTPMWVASCTKLMTTVAVMQCVEKGLFTLDEDISRILPEWKSPDILTGFEEKTGEPILRKAAKFITPRQLVTHSSGMGYDMLNPKLMALRKYQGRESATLSTDIVGPYSQHISLNVH
jgi:CubicO group peptidase (beta-lactamase class C family)